MTRCHMINNVSKHLELTETRKKFVKIYPCQIEYQLQNMKLKK